MDRKRVTGLEVLKRKEEEGVVEELLYIPKK